MAGIINVSQLLFIMTDLLVSNAQAASQDSIPRVVAEVVSDSTLHNISSMISTTASNTTAGWRDNTDLMIAVLAFIVAIISALIAWNAYLYTKWTFLSQQKTEVNTSRLTEDQQYNLLLDMIRHLYRNLVVSYGLKEKMRIQKYAYYPSEEHLQKLKVNLNDIHLELFYRKEELHKKMNELYLMLRNYNLEIDVFCNHFKDPNIDNKTKGRDLGTLVHKCSLLTEKIVERVELIWPQRHEEFIAKIKVDITKNQEENIGDPNHYYKKMIEPYDGSKSYYTTLFGKDATDFFMNLELNIKKECGINNSEEEILHMIKLK